VRRGAEPCDIARRVYENNPLRKYRLLGMVLNTLDLIDATDGVDGVKIATLLVTKEMFAKAGADKDDADGFVNYARGIEGVQVGMLMRETGPNQYKVSLRSKGEVDVALVSMAFGGGGHRNAAGFTADGTLGEIKAKVIAAVKERILATEVL